jgi:hypothetical protein
METSAIFDVFSGAGYKPLRFDSGSRQWVAMRGPEEISHMLNVRWALENPLVKVK